MRNRQLTPDNPPTEEELRQEVQKFIERRMVEDPEHSDTLTVDGLLEKEEARQHLRRLIEKRRNIAKIALQTKIREQMDITMQALREEVGVPPPLSQEEIKGKLAAPPQTFKAKVAVAGVTFGSGQSDPPAGVLSLKESFGSALDECVYQSADEAALFRAFLISLIKPFHKAVRQDGLEQAHKDRLLSIRAELQVLIKKVDQVVTAWGLEIGSYVGNSKLLADIRNKGLADKRYAQYAYVPKCESPAQRTAREQVEADAKAADEAEQKQREERRMALKALLLESDPDKTADETPEQKAVREKLADKLAARLVKHNFEKLSEGVTDTQLLRSEAISRMAVAKDESDKKMAMRFALAAGMTDEDLDLSVNAYREMHTDESQVKTQTSAGDESSVPRSPLASKTKGDRAARDKARRDRQAARQAADNAARPKPNNGSGDITTQSMGGDRRNNGPQGRRNK